MKISYNWLQEYFEEILPSVQELENIFMMHAFEVDDIEEVRIGEKTDWIIDLDVLPNRAHDSLGHRGIAKELSVLLDKKLKKDELLTDVTQTTTQTSKLLAIDVQDTALCPRYTGALIKGVKVAESPQWLKEKLEVMGQKSINNVVDITNYVLFGLGQPTHVFDADKLTDNNGITIGVRHAKQDEAITVLGGQEYTLDENITVITDAHSDTPIAIAGIKGGVQAEVGTDTVNIVVESAKFHPIKTRKASAQLRLRTDAVQRFENEIATRLPLYGALEVARLITEVAGGEIEGYVDTNKDADAVENKSITITLSGLNAFLGSTITANEADAILKRFGWDYTIDGESITVTPPFERLDINIPEDVYEEIGRVYGFADIIGEALPEPAPKKFINKEYAYAEIVRGVLLDFTIPEITTYTLTDHGDIELASILSSDKNFIRANLTDAMADALERGVKNAPLLGAYTQVTAFEIGRVFPKSGEHTALAVGVSVLAKKKRAEKQDALLDTIQKALEDKLGAPLQGVTRTDGILECNLTKTIAPLPTPNEYPSLPRIKEDFIYKPLSSYPFIVRDIAVWTPENTAPNIITDIIKKHGGALVQRIDLFDTFEKDGRTSLAFHIVFQSMEETLTDEQLTPIMHAIENDLHALDGFEVR